MGQYYLMNFTDTQKLLLQQIKEQTGYSIAELVRRSTDFAMKEDNLNDWLPMFSGQIKVDIKE